MEIREVVYEADGRRMTGRLAVPDGDGPHPAVLIAHEGPGLDDVQLARAERMAELGFVGFALDYHGDAAPFSDREAMMVRLGQLMADADRTHAIGRAALDVLLAEPTVDPTRLAVIGYCFGGTLALELARSGAPLGAVVGFHPGLTSPRPADSANIAGKVLICLGSEDPFVPREQRLAFEAEMDAAGVEWELQLYGGVVHSFTHPRASGAGLDGIAYDERADRRSWRAMLDLFDEVFGSTTRPA